MEMKDVMLLTGAGQIGMAIAPGIIVTLLAIDEFNGPRGAISTGR